MSKALMVVAHHDFRDEEYEIPRGILEGGGVEVKVASSGEHATGKFGLKVDPDYLFGNHIPLQEFDAIVFVGGPGAREYFTNHDALDLVRKAIYEDKVLAAICIAPSILANAGVLAGHKATCFPEEQYNLEDKGAFYTGRLVERDKKIITGNGPQASEEFGKLILKAISEQ